MDWPKVVKAGDSDSDSSRSSGPRNPKTLLACRRIDPPLSWPLRWRIGVRARENVPILSWAGLTVKDDSGRRRRQRSAQLNRRKHLSHRRRAMEMASPLLSATSMSGLGRALLAAMFCCAAASSARAEERLCDASAENCRTPLIGLIDNERVGIDVGMWFMKDYRYAAALIRAQKRGVRIRILMDTRANATYPENVTPLNDMAAAG